MNNEKKETKETPKLKLDIKRVRMVRTGVKAGARTVADPSGCTWASGYTYAD